MPNLSMSHLESMHRYLLPVPRKEGSGSHITSPCKDIPENHRFRRNQDTCAPEETDNASVADAIRFQSLCVNIHQRTDEFYFALIVCDLQRQAEPSQLLFGYLQGIRSLCLNQKWFLMGPSRKNLIVCIRKT